MKRRHFLLGACALVPACGMMPGQGLALAPNSTLIVTRHADRDGEDLNARGKERARALVMAVKEFEIDLIYSPGIKRNLDTAAPLSKARGLVVNRLPQEAPTGGLVQNGAGKTLIWIGNKGNIATIWEDLGLPEPMPIEYGDLHIVRADAQGRVTVERRRYGPR
ncbi:histidine phosphatase family protein [Mameliella alba]|nr:histidine phosphatase family protein [Mameliella alba]MBY6170892.1 histidine phosphatase family protein [Mameliella alba]MBY6175905.1 histidine phosphatase family protein [Mameliella alba]